MKKQHTSACFLLLAFFITLASAEASPRKDVLQGPIRGEVIEVLDGDTVSVRLQVWIGQRIETHVRFAGIDTPEIRGKCAQENTLAKKARDEVAALLQDGQVTLSDIRLEKYAGRVMATVMTANGINIAEHLISKGYARTYQGKKRQGWCGRDT